MNQFKYNITAASAVNNKQVLSENLAASPMIKEKIFPLVTKEGFNSASAAYNEVIKQTDADIIIFAHQDVYFPKNWELNLFETIENLKKLNQKWAVLGLVGKDSKGNLFGHCWSNGLQMEIKTQFQSPCEVNSLDEIVIVINKKTGVTFDANLPSFHLYGTDIVQTALSNGFKSFVFDAPVIHNSVRYIKYDKSYIAAYRYLQKKWADRLPINTTVASITKSGLAIYGNKYFAAKMKLLNFIRRIPQSKRHENPQKQAEILGY